MFFSKSSSGKIKAGQQNEKINMRLKKEKDPGKNSEN